MSQNKTKISITLDTDLLERYKKVAEARDENLSSCINRQLANHIDDIEELLEMMDSKFYRTIAKGMTSSPKFFKTVARMLGENLPEDLLEQQFQIKKEMIEQGEKRSAEKKRKKKPNRDGLEPA
ncbi:MAG: hypothetical protein CMJ19_15220 [Phycisphaeraceae bacterium]|nr:hypothetical protein [Phycisphaeraceae bacterium]